MTPSERNCLEDHSPIDAHYQVPVCIALQPPAQTQSISAAGDVVVQSRANLLMTGCGTS